VARVVQPDPSQLRPIDERLEPRADVLGVQRRSELVGEDVALGDLRGPGCQPLGLLPGLVRAQGRYETRVEGDRAAAGVGLRH